jgi:hypothetical protein
MHAGAEKALTVVDVCQRDYGVWRQALLRTLIE